MQIGWCRSSAISFRPLTSSSNRTPHSGVPNLVQGSDPQWRGQIELLKSQWERRVLGQDWLDLLVKLLDEAFSDNFLTSDSLVQ